MAQAASKIVLAQGGDKVFIPPNNIFVTLSWLAVVDLDLQAFYRASKNITSRGGFLGFGGIKPGKEGKVYYVFKGSLEKFPWIKLAQDTPAGKVGTLKEEHLQIATLNELEHVLLTVGIFNHPRGSFADYEAKVTVKTDEQIVEFPLTSTIKAKWYIVAHIDNSSSKDTKLININKVQTNYPKLRQFV